MTLKVMRAKKARIPQQTGAAKSTAQKKLLSVGWMNRCSCEQEGNTHSHTDTAWRHAAWRRGHGLGHRGRGGGRPRASKLSNLQWFCPASSTSFHHLSPTSSRPETFLTVQKSIAERMVTITKVNT